LSGGTLTAGILLQSAAPNAYDDELVVNTAAAVGDKEIEVTVTSGHGGYDANHLKEWLPYGDKGKQCYRLFLQD